MFSGSQSEILRVLVRSGAASRTVLAARCGLSKPAVTAVARELIAAGVVEEVAAGEGGRSRPLGVRAEGGRVLGLAIEERGAGLVLSDLGGAALRRTVLALPKRLDAWTPERLADAVAQALPGLLGGLAATTMGVSVPGVVDLAGRVCVQSTRLGWSGVALAEMIEARTNLAVRLENDANALARGMQMFGALRACPNFSLVSVEQGIGCGHIVDGRLLRGARGAAGEIAHATMRPAGVPCRCGKRGCLDVLASLRAITAASKAVRLPDEPAALQRIAEGGYVEAIRVLHEAGSMLGLGLAQMIQSLDPARVVVAVDPALGDGIYGAAARREVQANVLAGFAGSAGGEPLAFVAIAREAWADGAAGVAAHHFLCGPDVF